LYTLFEVANIAVTMIVTNSIKLKTKTIRQNYILDWCWHPQCRRVAPPTDTTPAAWSARWCCQF